MDAGRPMNATASDAALIRGMLARGDKQSDIAAFFGINGGRISEINTGKRHPKAVAAPADELPPPGPYLIGRTSSKAREALFALRDLINETLTEIDFYEGLREE
jgi:hypothetical protein